MGLGTHAKSEIVYGLDGEFDGRFEAWVGVDAEMTGRNRGSVVFQVFGDDERLFDSGVMRSNQPAKRVSVSVTGVTELRLVVTDAGDGINCDHADWADALVIGQRSETPSPAAEYEVARRGFGQSSRKTASLSAFHWERKTSPMTYLEELV